MTARFLGSLLTALVGHGVRGCWAPLTRRALVLICLLGGVAGCSTALVRAADAPETLYVFDARYLRTNDLSRVESARRVWDTWHALAALQGLANRSGPRLYVHYCQEFGVETDVFWWDWLRGEGQWLKDRPVRTLASFAEVLDRFGPQVKGLVVYDPAVPATSNLASTAAGCEDLLPVRFDPAPDSLYAELTGARRLPVRLWLVNRDGTPRFTGRGVLPDYGEPSCGSAKGDAYRWAVRRYLQSGGCAPGEAAYYVDAAWLRFPQRAGPELHTLPNHDFFIARRGFFFDLSAWGDEPATDDPQQPLGTDVRVLREVLAALAQRAGDRMVRIGGFTPWPFKYTDHGAVGGKHGGVPTEWEFSRLVSQYNAFVEADAAGLSALANASCYQHFPLAERYPQPARPPAAEGWRARGWVEADGRPAARLFVGHYVGDYDAPSWLYKAVPVFFRDPQRGAVPLGWAFNPNLADRVPQAMVYARRHATTNDYFIAGDSGAGYVNPRALTVRPDSQLPPALEIWSRHCAPYYRQWDLTVTGFVLDGSAGASTEAEFSAYGKFSPDGLGTHFEPGPALRAGVATCPERDLPDDARAAAAVIAQAGSRLEGRSGFLWARSILKGPSWYAAVADHLRREHPGVPVEFVDPYTFFALVRRVSER